MKYILVLMIFIGSMLITSCGSKPNSHTAYHKFMQHRKQKKRVSSKRHRGPISGKTSWLFTGNGNWNHNAFGGNR